VKVQFKTSFKKDLRNIENKDLLNRIKDTIEQTEKALSLQDITNIRKLKGTRTYYRIRVGEYRVGLTVDGDEAVFVRCLDRKEIYRYFP
jgi:mRNA interferase RelE/StbE